MASTSGTNTVRDNSILPQCNASYLSFNGLLSPPPSLHSKKFPLIYYQVPGRQIDSTSFNISSDLQLSNDKPHQCHCPGYLTAKMKMKKHKSHADKKPPHSSHPSTLTPKSSQSPFCQPCQPKLAISAISFEQELWQQRHKLHAGHPRLSNEDCRPRTVPICFAQEIRWVIMSMTLIMMMVVMVIYKLWWSVCL